LGGWNVHHRSRQDDVNDFAHGQHQQQQQQRNDAATTVAITPALSAITMTNGGVDTAAAASSSSSSSTSHAYLTAPPLRFASTTTLSDSRHSSLVSTTSSTTFITSNKNTTNNNNNNSTMNTTGTSTGTSMPHRRAAAAIWKRVQVEDDDHELGFTTTTTTTTTTRDYNSDMMKMIMMNKRCRVVDAVLEQDERSTKRRKLTVLGESNGTTTNSEDTNNHHSNNYKQTTRNKSSAYRVLDPVTRLVDDSLNMVHAGNIPAQQHYNLIMTDPRLAVHARSWLIYCNRTGGNLLHACAHWNEVELTHDLLRQNLPLFTDATDEDDRTPYEVATLSGHESIVQILEAFGADTTNYVYDMFVPEEIEMQTEINGTSMMNMNGISINSGDNVGTGEESRNNWNPLEKTPIGSDTDTDAAYPAGATGCPASDMSAESSVPAAIGTHHRHQQQQQQQQQPFDFSHIDTSRLLALQGGVGYWTEDGELILEVEPHHMIGLHHEYDHDTDDDEHDEDDIDSNCEEYGGNDYPDEDYDDLHWEEQFLREEPVTGEENSDFGVGDDDDDDNHSGEYSCEDDAW